MLRSLFALAVIGLFALFAIRSHYAAMLMYWWFGIFRPHEWMWWDLSALRLPLIAAGLFVLPAILHGKLPVLRGAIPLLILSLLVVSVIGNFLAGCMYPDVWSVIPVSILIFVSLLSATFIKSHGAIVGMLAVVGLSLCLKSAPPGLSTTVGGGNLYNISIGGGSFSGTNAVALGSAMAIFLLAVVYQFVRADMASGTIRTLLSKPAVRLIALSVLVTNMVGAALFVIGTQSRGSALALGLGVLVWIALHKKRGKFLLVAILIGTVGISIVPLPDGYVDRISAVFDDSVEQDRSAASRPHFWHTARAMAADRTFGVGVGCFRVYYDAYDDSDGFYGKRRSVHSSHYLVVAEQGYPGAFLWFSLLGTALLKLWSIRRESRASVDEDEQAWQRFHICNGLITALVVFVFGSSFYEFVYNDYTWLIFATIIALDRMRDAEKEHRRDRSNEQSSYAA